jgi:hypothetical protein
MKFSNKGYNVLKQVALVWLPALATLYAGLAALWSLGHVAEVVGTISAVDTFMGLVLHLSSSSYSSASDGKLVVDKSDPLKDTYSLEITTPIDKLAGKDSIKLNVVPSA